MRALDLINESTLLQEEHYKLSSTQLNLPPAHADYVLKWGRQMIPDDHLHYDDKGGMGRETEPHITVLYGLTDKAPSEELMRLIRKTPPFTVRLGAITFFENDDYDVVKFECESEELVALSNAIRKACPNENKYPKYVPHCTVAYVKHGSVPDLAGNYPFEQNPPIPAEFEVNEILFKPAGESGDPNRKVVHIPLNRHIKEAEDPKQFIKKVLRQPDEELREYLRTHLFKRDPEKKIEWWHRRTLSQDDDGEVDVSRVGYKGKQYWVVARGRGETHLYSSGMVDGAKALEIVRSFKFPEIRDGKIVLKIPRAVGEAETPKAALQLKRITRALQFWQVPEGFYFRTVWYPLVKREYDRSGTGCNAVTTDLDMVRHLRIGERDWVFPPEWTIDDITSGEKLEAMLKTVNNLQEGLEGMEEGEDPKEVFRKAVAGAPMFYLTRDKDAYGKPLKKLHYLYVRVDPVSKGLSGTWTEYPRQATQFRTVDECWEVMKRLWGDDMTYWENALRPKKLYSFEKERERMFIEAEDPKAFLRSRKKWDVVTIRWVDQHGQEHTTRYYELPSFMAREELEKNLVINKSPYTVAKVLDVSTEQIAEAEDPKRVLNQAAHDAFVIWNYAAGNWNFFKLEPGKLGGTYMWTGEPHLATRFRSGEEAVKALSRFYKPEQQTLFNIHITPMSQAQAFQGEAEDPKQFIKQVAPRPPKCIVGRWKQAGPETMWSYWSWLGPDDGWEFDQAMRATIIEDPQRQQWMLAAMREEKPDYNWKLVDPPPQAWRYFSEAKEKAPFDMLNFPTDASVLVAKLLDLEQGKKKTTLL